MLQNKTGPAQQKALKGYLSGMMVLNFSQPICHPLRYRPGQIFLYTIWNI